MMTEKQYGRRWRALAKKEGHRKGLPPVTVHKPVDTSASLYRRVGQYLRKGDMTPVQIARVCRCTRDRVEQIAAEIMEGTR